MLSTKLLVLVSQLGRVWAKNHMEKKIFSSMTAIGFFLLYLKTREDDKRQNNDYDY
jgi:hypothetical protein